MVRDAESDVERVDDAAAIRYPGLLEAFIATRTELVRFFARRVRCLFTARDLAQ